MVGTRLSDAVRSHVPQPPFPRFLFCFTSNSAPRVKVTQVVFTAYPVWSRVEFDPPPPSDSCLSFMKISLTLLRPFLIRSRLALFDSGLPPPRLQEISFRVEDFTPLGRPSSPTGLARL